MPRRDAAASSYLMNRSLLRVTDRESDASWFRRRLRQQPLCCRAGRHRDELRSLLAQSSWLVMSPFPITPQVLLFFLRWVMTSHSEPESAFREKDKGASVSISCTHQNILKYSTLKNTPWLVWTRFTIRVIYWIKLIYVNFERLVLIEMKVPLICGELIVEQ